MSLQSASPSSTAAFTSTPSPLENASGTQQMGSWNTGSAIKDGVIESLPAAVRTILPAGTNPSLTQVGSKQQYKVTLSLSGTNTVTLSPACADANQAQTAAISPDAYTFTYVSRNVKVATVSAGGLVTAVGRGEVEIAIRSFRQVNASFGDTFPSQTEGVDAYLNVQVLA